MKGNWKWPLLLAALIMLAATWLDTDLRAFSQLSPGDLLPVIRIAAVIFLAKTGALSLVLLGLRKLWNRIRKKT